MRLVRAGALVVIALIAAVASLWPSSPLTGPARVTDGDTLRVAGERVRLVGLDAPEIGQACTHEDGRSWACGEAARAGLVRLIGGEDVLCQPEGRDRYGRVLAKCGVGGRDLGAAMVASGLALSSGRYPGQEKAARSGRAGLWSGRFERPRRYRDDKDEAALPEPLRWVRQWFR